MPTRYRPEQFAEGGFGAAAAVKTTFVNELLDFMDAGYARDRFTRAVYDGLTGPARFGFRRGNGPAQFYETHFGSEQQQAEFRRDLQFACAGSPRIWRPDLWSDVRAVLLPHLHTDSEAAGAHVQLSPFTVVATRTARLQRNGDVTLH